jgi:peptide-methionine (S)-S-oxide reductase
MFEYIHNSQEDYLQGSKGIRSQETLHLITSNSLYPPFPNDTDSLVLGMGCFWGAEKLFYKLNGIYVTAVGYSGGVTTNPSYEQVCTGKTGHAEVVLIVFYPQIITLNELLKIFWENHDPTQLNKQGNDVGTQYRSLLTYKNMDEKLLMEKSYTTYNSAITKIKKSEIKTEIVERSDFYYAEQYHQQYLIKNPYGYCNHGFNGVTCVF